jgi:hypothetical protein
MRREGDLLLCMVLPDGSKALIPAAWTDIGSDETPTAVTDTLGSLADLLHLRTVTDGLIHRTRTAEVDDPRQASEEEPV